MNRVQVYRLGRVEYADGLTLQQQFSDARRAGVVDDTLLLLEHPPVLTMGRAAKLTNIVAPEAELARRGVRVFETDRGGDVTYHGPGQLVGYPLLFLPPGKQDVRRYVRSLEEIIIRTLADFGLTAERIEKWPGVWLRESRAGGPRKICALGVHLSRWHTRHGFALNLAPNLEHFRLIVPCGITEAGVTSMQAELGQAPTEDAVVARLTTHFAEVFECELVNAAPPPRTVSVVVTGGGPGEARVLALQRVPSRGGFWQPVTGRVEAGEGPAETAARELNEETGFAGPVRPLGYAHAFAWGEPPRGPGTEGDPGLYTRAPVVAQETAFAAQVEGLPEPRLSPQEHDAWAWLRPDEALERFPYEGLRVATRAALAGVREGA